MHWGATKLGRLFTSSRPWSLKLDNDQFVLSVNGKRFSGNVLQLEQLSIRTGLFWAAVRIVGAAGQAMELDGIPNGTARRMHQAITSAIRHQRHIAELLRGFLPAVHRVQEWATSATEACRSQFRNRGWLSHEFKQLWESSKPTDLGRYLEVPELGNQITSLDESKQDAIRLWRQPFAPFADNQNRRFLEHALVESRSFFDKVEKSPLTKEQAAAVTCFDNRVLLVASAGSGKTSVMVAKAGYALTRNYFSPDRMLLLAFNNDAAAELRERLKARLEPLGLPADKVVARTFHAFGLEVIGAATGKKPSLAPWVESGRDLDALLQMVDELKDRDPSFRST